MRKSKRRIKKSQQVDDHGKSFVPVSHRKDTRRIERELQNRYAKGYDQVSSYDDDSRSEFVPLQDGSTDLQRGKTD
jgi:hypothetical protein